MSMLAEGSSETFVSKETFREKDVSVGSAWQLHGDEAVGQCFVTVQGLGRRLGQ